MRDYGRGIPLGKLKDCASKINTGAKYDSEAFKKSVGLNGVGIKAVNALSSEFQVQAYREGVGVTVIDPRWVKPLPQSLITMADRYKSVVVVEDGIAHGGIASALSEMFRSAGLDTPIHSIGVPLTFIEHSKRSEILNDLGITSQNIAREIVEWSSSTLKAEMPLPQGENESHRQNR